MNIHCLRKSLMEPGILFFINLFFFLIYWLRWVLLLRTGFLYLQRAGATLRCSAQASHCGGFFC